MHVKTIKKQEVRLTPKGGQLKITTTMARGGQVWEVAVAEKRTAAAVKKRGPIHIKVMRGTEQKRRHTITKETTEMQ